MELRGCHFPHHLWVSEFYHSTMDCQETEKWSVLFFEADYQLHIQKHNHLLFPGNTEGKENKFKQVITETGKHASSLQYSKKKLCKNSSII